MSPPPALGLTDYPCPLCAARLWVQPGTQLDPNDGVTVYCANLNCPAPEVFGHGSNEKSAYQIIKEKYRP